MTVNLDDVVPLAATVVPFFTLDGLVPVVHGHVYATSGAISQARAAHIEGENAALGVIGVHIFLV